MSEKIKVTECWTIPEDDGRPDWAECREAEIWENSRRTILMWREYYDALIKERDELRKRCRYNLDPGAQITCWDEYESLRVRYDAMRTELEELRGAAKEWQRFKEHNRDAWMTFWRNRDDK